MASAADPWHFEAGRHTRRLMTQNDEMRRAFATFTSLCFVCAAGALFPFNEDQATDEEVDRNSAVVGGKSHAHASLLP